MKSINIQNRTVGEVENLTASAVINRILASRGVTQACQLQYELKQLLSYTGLKDIDKAVLRLKLAIEQQQTILIVGDFDCDGATATAVTVLALKKFGAKHVDYIVPNRFEYGYGLTPEIVELAKAQQPDVIITVDNGIASVAGVEKANELGIDVIVTDHHLAGKILPKAHAIVNPNQPGDEFPSKHMAGVGVAFYVMLALRKALNLAVNMGELLDLVALGTVADVVRLDQNNQILVQQGLLRVRAGQCREGIKALLAISKRQLNEVTSMDLAFTVGPRLNAAGRLHDMSIGIQCLLTDSADQAEILAKQLDELNRERREIEGKMQKEAFAILKNLHFTKTLPLGVCLFDKAWHQGVVGLLASRIKEQYHRPVIAFAEVGENELKGSARSIAGVHIRDVLDEIATSHPTLLNKFGGHAMAAGLSLQKTHFDQFADLFAKTVSEKLNGKAPEASLTVDGELLPSEFNLSLFQQLKYQFPWGQGFEEPLFCNWFEVVNQRLVAERHLKCTLQFPKTEQYVDAIYFNVDLQHWPNHRVHSAQFVYQIDLNTYNGITRPQIIVRHIEGLHSV